MEGITGLADPHEILAFAQPYWRTGRARMTADVAAAAEGLLAAGADEVVVLDNHASGNPVNILAGELPDRARLATWDVHELADRGVDAMLQVGYHARAEIDAFISHTYVPDLRLRVDGEPISESHGRAWAARVPLLGIAGNDRHAETLGALTGTPYLVTQRTTGRAHREPAFPGPEEAAEAIRAFAAEALRAGGEVAPAPRDFEFAATVPAGSEIEQRMAEAGWEQRSEGEFAASLPAWPASRPLLSGAMAAAFVPWMPYFTSFDLTSEHAVELVHDDPVLEEGRRAFDAWLA